MLFDWISEKIDIATIPTSEIFLNSPFNLITPRLATSIKNGASDDSAYGIYIGFTKWMGSNNKNGPNIITEGRSDTTWFTPRAKVNLLVNLITRLQLFRSSHHMAGIHNAKTQL